MSSSYGENIHLTLFGQSHSPAVGMTLEGLPAGERIDPEVLQRFLQRRAPATPITRRRSSTAATRISRAGDTSPGG